MVDDPPFVKGISDEAILNCSRAGCPARPVGTRSGRWTGGITGSVGLARGLANWPGGWRRHGSVGRAPGLANWPGGWHRNGNLGRWHLETDDAPDRPSSGSEYSVAVLDESGGARESGAR